MGCCPEETNNCTETNLGCLNQISAECIIVNDADLIASIPGAVVGDDLEAVLLDIISYIVSTFSSYTYEPTGIGEACIDGGDPFSFDTWLLALEEKVCALNAVVDLEVAVPSVIAPKNRIIATFDDASTKNLDLYDLKVNDTVFVDIAYGDDSTGVRENAEKPFQTIDAAIQNMADGDTIRIRNGSYTFTTDRLNLDTLSSVGITYVFYLEAGTDLTVYTSDGTGTKDLGEGRIVFLGERENTILFSNLPNNGTIECHNINLVNLEAPYLLRNTSSVFKDINDLRVGTGLIANIGDSAFTQNSGQGTHLFERCNIKGNNLATSALSYQSGTTEDYVITLKNSTLSQIGNLIITDTVDRSHTSTLNLIDCEIDLLEDAFDNPTVAERSDESFDYFKNTRITTINGSAYALSTNHIGSVKMINVRLEGTAELAIQTTTADAELQNVWSNQYSSNPLVQFDTSLEQIHIDGEDNTVSIDDTDSPYTMGSERKLIVASTGGDVTINFPPANRVYREITIIGAGGANDMILTPNGAETLNGSASSTLNTASNTIRKIMSDGNNLYGYATISF